MIDNFELVLPFVPSRDDGDTFIYTEMLDRGKHKGNNGQRLLKTFYHRSQDEFREQMETIRRLCDMGKVRACTRLAPRSYKVVGKVFTEMVVNAALTDNWAGMKTLYNRACGTARPNTKLWLFDVDVVDDASRDFEEQLRGAGVLMAVLPSKKGLHYVSRPFPLMGAARCAGDGRMTEYPNIQVHKDNPTNLYIPDGAD